MRKYPLFKVHVPLFAALRNMETVLSSGFINEGVQVTELTQALQEKLGATNLVLVNSCTSALTLAMKLAGVGPGSDVISTPMTCVATNTPIVNLGGQIVWADVDPVTGMVRSTDVEKKITKNTKAVVVVAWAGTPPDLWSLKTLCLQRNIKLILDAAHAFGATYSNLPIHQWADYTTYSFQAIKHFTTGDGGAIVCNDDNDYSRVKAMKWFGLDRDHAKDAQGNWKGQQWDVDIKEAGFKFNMNNLSAALGLAQMESIDEILQRHRANAKTYINSLAGSQLFISQPKNCQSSFWVMPAKVLKTSRVSRDELLAKLNDEGIEAGLVHVPNDGYTAFDQFKTTLPGCHEFAANQINLPCGWWLSESDIKHISKRIWELTT